MEKFHNVVLGFYSKKHYADFHKKYPKPLTEYNCCISTQSYLFNGGMVIEIFTTFVV